jgi:WD40 repeat protein
MTCPAWSIARYTYRQPRLLSTMTDFGNAPVYSVAFNHDGRLLAAGGADDTVRLWDVTHPDLPTSLGQPLTGPVGYVDSVTFAPHQNILAAGSAHNTVWLWELTQPRQPAYLATLTGPTNAVLTVAFNPNGHTLAASGHDRTVRLWNINPDDAATWTCSIVGTPITEQEWHQYIPERRYNSPCP